MQFPFYRKRTSSGWVDFVKMVGPELSLCVTVFTRGGMPDAIIKYDATDITADIQYNYREGSTAEEFNAAYQSVQEKINNAIKQ